MDIKWLIDVIDRKLKDAETIVDNKCADDATSSKISVHVGADNVVTLSSDLVSIIHFSPLEKKENTRRKSLWARTKNSVVYTSIAIRLKLYQWRY